MNDQQTMLNRLCMLSGIGLDYTDIWGNPHPIDEETQKALLGAMGFNVDSEQDIRQSLDALENRCWQRVMPPVKVVREQEAPYEILVTLPENRSDELTWLLILENGERHEGSFQPRDLQREEQCRIGDTSFVRYTFLLPRQPGWGYHRLELHGLDETAAMTLIVAPETCYRPAAIQGENRVWGTAVQLYSLRSQRNWGVGDYSDLKAVVEFCAEQGAGIVGVSPIHALFPDNPEHASPYGPSSRLFLNVLYLDIEAIPDFAECDSIIKQVRADAFQAQLRALRAEEMVQYAAVAALKLPVLGKLYAHFRKQHLDRETDRGRNFRDFQAEHGVALHRQALFEALQAHFKAKNGSVWGWPAWPEAYRDPESPEVARFLEKNREKVEFYVYLQWQAHLQLAAIGRRSCELGLGVGLLLDLAVSISRGGGEGWANQKLYAIGASVGAPPDDFSLTGQDWGLPPFIPHALTEAAYAPFIDTLRAGMVDAGALRIDHVMGLFRLFWVPPGKSAAEGAYVYYPFDDMLGILALESQRNHCLIVGEDLGTVPNEVRQGLEQLGVHSYRLQYFEKDWSIGSFKAPNEYPEQALVAVTTHDLATLAGFWQGRDLEVRHSLGLFPSEESREAQIVARAQDCARLLVALEREGLLPQGSPPYPVSVPEMSPEYAQAVHAYLARTPSKLMLMQLEDMLGQIDQVNLPGTTESQYPNWRRKLPLNIEEWRGDPRAQGLTETLRRERGSSVQPQPPPRSQGSDTVPFWRVPRATYRLQFNSRFTFADAALIVDYLDQLGISHCYASPYLKARPGSPHGYDIIDHNAINPEIGSQEEFEHFVTALKMRDMGQILDIVPNHMGVMGSDNSWWLDVLENGPASAYAQYFDIDWFPATEQLQGRVLLPVLGEHYGTVLENGELKLAFDANRGEFSVFYYEHRFPVDPREYARILGYGLDKLGARLGVDHPQVLQFQSLVTAFSHLPGRLDIKPEKVAERNRDKEILKQHLAALYASSADIVQFIEDMLGEFNGGAGELDRYELLHSLLSAQAYRLAYWRVAADEINYRRFFDINDLAALRMENAAVFETTHCLISHLLASGKVDGLRLDHTDGLYDPVQYFHRLRQMATALLTPAAAEETERMPLYIVVEKILAAHEHLPEHWPISGTTGYDFMNLCNGLFIDPAAAEKMDRIYAEFIEHKMDYDELRYASKRLLMRVSMTGELNVLAHQLALIARADRRTCDYTLNSLRSALAEVVSCFPVYRTYVSTEQVSPEDARHVDWAIGIAKKRSQAADLGVFDFIRDVLLKLRAEGKNHAHQEAVVSFAMKFQQYTSPVMAKGMEDTSFYLYNRLISLNEVGGDPRRFGVPISAFHRATHDRAKRFPHAMLATSTHDSKRSEDMRARINALSEMPDEWQDFVSRWSRINQVLIRTVDDKPAPSRNDEYLIYQTLVGIWPLEELDDTGRAALCERVEAYMLKAVREAKAHSSWINPRTEYEDAVTGFVRELIGPAGNRRFLTSFFTLQKRISRLGILNSLSQMLLKLTAPGVPDIYQGTEIWDFSLVDPDNRRKVDYRRRQAMLKALQREFEGQSEEIAGKARQLLDTAKDGRIKLYLLWKTLNLRRQRELLFRDGDYQPLKVTGRRADHVCAYLRQYGGQSLIVLVPRLFLTLTRRDTVVPIGQSVWRDTVVEIPTSLASSNWRNIYTEETISPHEHEEGAAINLTDVFMHFPYGLLVVDDHL
jgi:(1->4)-alpha-D-glucan 1-alpha-D-glucosylmutase